MIPCILFLKFIYFLLISGLLASPPTLLPGRHALNFSMLLGNIGAMGWFMTNDTSAVGLSMLGVTTSLSSIMGVTLTMAIGGKIILKMACSHGAP